MPRGMSLWSVARRFLNLPYEIWLVFLNRIWRVLVQLEIAFFRSNALKVD